MSRTDRSPFFPRSGALPVIDGNGVEIHAGADPRHSFIDNVPRSRRLEQRASYILHYHADTIVGTLRRSDTLLLTLVVQFNVSAQCSMLLFSLEL